MPRKKKLELAWKRTEPAPEPPPPPDLERLSPVEMPMLEAHVPDEQTGEPTEHTLPVAYVPWFDKLNPLELRDALTLNDTPTSMRPLLTALSDPKQSHLPISILAGRCGIRIQDLMEVWRSAKKIEAMGVALSHSPTIALHTAVDARSSMVCCNRCDGAGKVRILLEEGYQWINCPTCRGKGRTRKPGDSKSREWILRAAKVINDTPMIVNQNIMRPGAASVLDELEELDRREAIEVTAIPDDDS